MPGYGEIGFGSEPYGTGIDSIVLEWGQPGKKFYETGIDKVVFFPKVGDGVAWNGVVAINEASAGGESESYFYDGVKYLDMVASEDFSATIEAYQAPREFAECDGRKALVPGLYVTNQPRKTFDLAYRTLIGNDLEGIDYGYKLHLVYNCTASPTTRTNRTVAGAITPDTKTWTLSTVPPPASTFKPTAHIVIDSREVDPYMLQNIESILYGRDEIGDIEAVKAAMPSLAQIISILGSSITELIEEFI
jgi:hypothetical protein